MTPPDQMRVLMNVPLGASVVSAAVQGDESSCVRLTSEQPPPLRAHPLQYKQRERQQYK